MEQLQTSDGVNAAESLGASTVAFLKNTWRIVRRRRRLLIAGWLLVYALGALYYYSRDYIYEARASVLVHLIGDALTGRNDERPNYIPTHMQMITSTAVLNRALEKLEVNDAEESIWPSVEELANSLKVSCQRDTEILNIAYQTKDKSTAAAAQAVNPLVVEGQKLIPSVTRVFSKSRDLFVYLQAYERNATSTQPLIAFVTFYRGQSKAFETTPIQVMDGLDPKSKALPLKFSLSLAKLPAGEYNCQVTVLDPTGQKAAFWQAPVILIP